VSQAETPNQIRKFNPQSLSNLAWAFAALGVAAPSLFKAIAAEAHAQIREFNPANLSILAWAFAKLGILAPRLFEAVAAESASKIRDFSPQNLANLTWAYATMGNLAPRLFEAVAAEFPAEAQKFMSKFKPQGLSNVAWAFATLGIKAPRVFEAILRAVPAAYSQLDQHELTQFHQVLLFLTYEAPELRLAPLLRDFRAEFRAAFVADEPSPSRTQGDVAAALERTGWMHEFEHVTPEGLSLDMAQPASKVAVEFDGPTHYLGDLGSAEYCLHGRFFFKNRLLQKLGWKVIHVPYFEWRRLESPSAQEDYLAQLLAPFMCVAFSVFEPSAGRNPHWHSRRRSPTAHDSVISPCSSRVGRLEYDDGQREDPELLDVEEVGDVEEDEDEENLPGTVS